MQRPYFVKTNPVPPQAPSSARHTTRQAAFSTYIFSLSHGVNEFFLAF
jgi:hypothetical protein